MINDQSSLLKSRVRIFLDQCRDWDEYLFFHGIQEGKFLRSINPNRILTFFRSSLDLSKSSDIDPSFADSTKISAIHHGNPSTQSEIPSRDTNTITHTEKLAYVQYKYRPILDSILYILFFYQSHQIPFYVYYRSGILLT